MPFSFLTVEFLKTHGLGDTEKEEGEKEKVETLAWTSSKRNLQARVYESVTRCPNFSLHRFVLASFPGQRAVRISRLAPIVSDKRTTRRNERTHPRFPPTTRLTRFLLRQFNLGSSSWTPFTAKALKTKSFQKSKLPMVWQNWNTFRLIERVKNFSILVKWWKTSSWCFTCNHRFTSRLWLLAWQPFEDRVLACKRI